MQEEAGERAAVAEAIGTRVRWGVAAVLLVVGAALRLWQYAADTSFWLDEIAIARNVLSRSLPQLLAEPLDIHQVAPVGFLAVEKLAVGVLGPSELAFRLYALVCGLCALALFWRLARRVLDSDAALFALALFAIAPPLIRYSAEAKQYGGDVLWAVALTLLAVRLVEDEPTVRRSILQGVAGALVALFSQTAVIVMAGLGAVLVARWIAIRDRRSGMPALATVPLWAAGCVAALVWTERTMAPATREFMERFWQRGFAPVPFAPGATLAWLIDRVTQLFEFEQMLHYPFAGVYVLALVAGGVALWRQRSTWIAWLVYAPLLVTMGAALARRYPFDRRLVLFLVPGVLIGVAAGVGALAGLAARARQQLGWAVIAAALAPPVWTILHLPPPYHVEPYKQVFAYLGAHRKPAEPVYVFRSAGLAATYYGPRNGLTPDGYLLGACDRENPRAYLEDVDRLRGLASVWVVTTAVTPMRPPQRNVTRYLDTIGIRREGLTVPSPFFGPATVHRYDLTDPTRLRSASAATFPVEPMMATFRPTCGGPLADIR